MQTVCNAEEIVVEHKGRPQKIYYDLYIPPGIQNETLPVIVCIGGLPIIDNKYAHADPKECRSEPWENFARENKMAILGLGFLFVDEDWNDQTSYQYAEFWSGSALLKILDKLFDEFPINKKEIYLYGVSAGAQFSTRFGLVNPEITKAVATHAAGGYNLPDDFIMTKFLVTVGELDNTEIKRVDWAKYFVQGCQKKGIDVRFHIIPDIAHRQTEHQDELSRSFFREVLKGGGN